MPQTEKTNKYRKTNMSPQKYAPNLCGGVGMCHLFSLVPSEVEAVEICSNLQRCRHLGHEFVWPRAQNGPRLSSNVSLITTFHIFLQCLVLGGNDHWGISKTLQRAGWWKAWALTECGTAAPWQVPETSWHGLMEPMHLATSWYANTWVCLVI